MWEMKRKKMMKIKQSIPDVFMNAYTMFGEKGKHHKARKLRAKARKKNTRK